MQSYDHAKRRRAADTLPLGLFLGPADPSLTPAVAWDDDAFWESFFNPLLITQSASEPLGGPLLNDGQSSSTRKRQREITPPPSSSQEPASSTWLATGFLDLEPSAVLLPARNWPSEIPNPFIVDGFIQHPRLRRVITPAHIPDDGCINGLIKVRLNFKKPNMQPVARLQKFPWSRFKSISDGEVDQTPLDSVSYLPPDFGRGFKLKPTDQKLFDFYRIAICAGVTLISTENCYIQEVAPIAARSDCVKHAILALAATYVIDYARDDQLKTRANFHWKRAVHLLSQELSYPETCQPGKEDAVIAALFIFCVNEVVNWELEHPNEDNPSWFRASNLAEKILAKSDPLYRYHFPPNVQCSRARIQLGNKLALYNILSATAWPLKHSEERCPFTWLLEGSEVDLRKIVGCTGCSPRLLHTFAQITHLSTKLYKNPQRLTAQKLGNAIIERLDNFWQWSDLSEGYATSEELLNSCKLDKTGRVSSHVKVTELIAETYVAAAQIYLYCRLFRKPRRHPKVQEALMRSLVCTARMPASGPLFTRQSVQFRVFLPAIVAYEPEHRAVIRDWFEEVCNGTRGNVPPVWRTVQFLWQWQDARSEITESEGLDDSNETKINVNAESWWEAMVAEIFTREGKLNLA